MALDGLQTRVDARVAARLDAWLYAERHQLPLLAPVGLGLGIVLWFMLPWAAERGAALVAAAALGAAGLALGGRAGRIAAWAGVLVALGLGVAALRNAQVAAPVLADRFTGDIAGTVEGTEQVRGGERFRFLLRPDTPGLPALVRISVKGEPVPGVAAGARVALKATLGPPAGPSVPGGYDFARKAWFAGIGATGYPLGPVTVTAPPPPPAGAVAWLDGLRDRIDARLVAETPGSAGPVAAALVTGDQGAIPESVNQAMRDAGLAHLLAVSGMNVAIVVGGTLWLVRRVLVLVPWLALRLPVRTIAVAAAALVGVAYTLLAGANVPVVRACLATLIVLLGVIIGREALTLRLIAAGAFVILLFRPEALLGPSFQLTFAAVTGIVALYQSRLGRWLAEPVADQGWIVSLGRHAAMLLVTGMVAEAMLSATALYHFNRAGLFGVAANLIAIPLTTFVITPLLALALASELTGIGTGIHWWLGQSIDLLTGLAFRVAAWPGAVLRLPMVPDSAYALAVAGGLWLCIWQTRVRWAAAVPVAAAVMIAATARPPDLLVSGDGRHAAYLVPDGRLAFLRDRAGVYIRDMWGNATAATTADVALAELPGARCSADACVADLQSGGRRWRLLATLSRDIVPRAAMAPACASADIVVSARSLPPWCAPRWLKLDRAALGASGAVAVWLDPPRTETVAARIGDHPWLPKPAPRRRAPVTAAAVPQTWD